LFPAYQPCARRVSELRHTPCVPSYAVETQALVKRYRSTSARVLCRAPISASSGRAGPGGPDSGTARVGGYDVTGEPARVRELIGVTGPFAAVDEALTGRENLCATVRPR
jgi:oleandomycin transport system ATP-binding protein